MKDLLRSVFGSKAGEAVQPTAPQAPATSSPAIPTAPAPADPTTAAIPQPSAADPSAAATQAPAGAGGMGGLGDVLGGILGGGGGLGGMLGGGELGGGGGLGTLMAILPAILGMLGGRGSGNKSGLESLLGGLQANGLGDHANSWVGGGPNQAVTPAQIQQGLGQETIDQVAQQAGVSPDEASQGLAQLLPGLVDHLTPNGQMPDAASLEHALEGLKGQLPTG